MRPPVFCAVVLAAGIFGTLSFAATLVPIATVQGSVSTLVTGVNKNAIVTGSWYDNSGVEHGFFGSYDGSNYTTFDIGSEGTEPRAIDNQGYIAGAYNTDPLKYLALREFERLPDGTILTISKRSKELRGYAEGLDSRNNVFVGEYMIGKTGYVHGYYGKDGRYKGEVQVAGSNFWTGPRAINNSGVISGWFKGQGKNEGFVLNAGTTTVVDYPNADSIGTYLEGISDKGIVSGFWYDANYVNYAFIYDPATSVFTDVVVPNATTAQAWQISSNGLVVVDSDVGNFIYCLEKKSCPVGGVEVGEHSIRSPRKPVAAPPPAP
ncbi:MAG TPA: hypothetical protein VNX86_09230 [Rhizomicrobium sp.]|jgi:hypothetical protein|nr:hypothetical protein [Rhizomicrobium sp.]